ncbi:helix-turn-helix transcriptional regulator [Oscillospiraceae bacterium 38-13]
MSAFSDHITFLRENRAILQKDLAKSLGISLHAYQRFEYGQQEPRMSILIALADFYGLSLDELVCRDWPEETH